MGLYENIKEDYKKSIKEKDNITKSILNYVLSLLSYKQKEIGKELEEDDIIKVIQKEIKNRYDYIEYLKKNNDKNMLDEENKKIGILEKYLPSMLEENELKDIIDQKVKDLNIEDIKKEKGTLIKSIMNDYKSRVDGDLLNKVIDNFK